jgi:hypothetical protein
LVQSFVVKKKVIFTILILLLSVAVTSRSFDTLYANATLDVSNSTHMEFHAIALPRAPNAMLIHSNPNIIFIHKSNYTLPVPTRVSGNNKAQVGIIVGKTPGNDGNCAYPSGCGQVTYHNGPVMHNTRIFIVFWVGGSFSGCSTSHYFEDSTNDPQATNPNDCSYMNLQVQFLQDICSDPFMHIAAQYTDGLGGAGPCFIATPPAGKFNPLVDTSAYPEPTLSFADIDAEAVSVANYMGATFDGNTEVFVFTPYTTPSCFQTNPNMNCFPTSYVAYHGFESNNGVESIIAYMPEAAAVCGSQLCSLFPSPNSDPVSDIEMAPLSHELMESLTDPTAGGWYYSTNQEIGDQCVGDFGSPNSDGSNIYLGIHGDPYLIQKEWSNSNGGCTLSEESLPAPPSTPTTGITASPISSSSISLTWTASTGATSYNIFRSTSSSGPFTTFAGSPTTTSFTDTGLSPNTTYYYELTASNTGGTSAISSTPASATTSSNGSCLPPAGVDWTITSSCTLTSSATASKNVIVNNGAVLTIPSGMTLTIPFKTNHLLIHSGGGVLIKAGGAIN